MPLHRNGRIALGIPALCAFSVLALVSLSRCQSAPNPNWPSVKGPEDAHVADGLQGTIVYEDAGEAFRLRLGQSKPDLLFPGTEAIRTHTVGGPDSRGRVAIVDNDMSAKRHGLRFIASGKPTTVFERSGDALWGDFKTDIHPISQQIAMSPKGQVAILKTLKYWWGPLGGIQQGTLEIWNIDSKTARTTTLQCLDEGMSWFPDDKRIAVVRLTDATYLRTHGLWPKGMAKKYTGKVVPAVHIVDMSTGKSEPFLVGEQPVVSQDGKTIFIEDDDANDVLVDIKTRTSKSVSVPGQWGPGLALTDDGRLIYWGIQTKGAKQKATVSNGLPGPRPMLTIKVANLKTGKFATLLPYIDPRSQASFGFGP